MKDSDIKLAAVVILYHPTATDFQNINTYLASIDHLYVIDNTASPHRHQSRLPHSSKVEYLTNGQNIGVAAALNLAAKKALASGYQWLLTNDQDTTFPKTAISRLKHDIITLDMTDVAIVTPWHNTKRQDPKPTEHFDDPHDVMTSGNIINLPIWQKLGGFKEWFFIDGIDIEYCLNLHRHGYRILRDNSVSIEHSLGRLFYKKHRGTLYLLTNHPPIRRYYMMRNYHYIYDLHKDYDPEYCLNLCLSQKHNMRGVFYFEKTQKFKKLWMYYQGYRHYQKGIKGKYPRQKD